MRTIYLPSTLHASSCRVNSADSLTMTDFPAEDTPVQVEQSHRISLSPRAVATSFARHQQVVLPMILLAVIVLTCTLSSGIVVVLFVTAAAVTLYSCIHRVCITSFLEFLEYLEWNNLDANYTDDRGGDSMVSALSEESKQKQPEDISAFLICRELLQYDSSVFASPDEGVPTRESIYWTTVPLLVQSLGTYVAYLVLVFSTSGN